MIQHLDPLLLHRESSLFPSSSVDYMPNTAVFCCRLNRVHNGRPAVDSYHPISRLSAPRVSSILGFSALFAGARAPPPALSARRSKHTRGRPRNMGPQQAVAQPTNLVVEPDQVSRSFYLHRV